MKALSTESKRQATSIPAFMQNVIETTHMRETRCLLIFSWFSFLVTDLVGLASVAVGALLAEALNLVHKSPVVLVPADYSKKARAISTGTEIRYTHALAAANCARPALPIYPRLQRKQQHQPSLEGGAAEAVRSIQGHRNSAPACKRPPLPTPQQ
jgi:hypothetical protein